VNDNPYQWTLRACIPVSYSYNFSCIHTDVKTPRDGYELLLKKCGERQYFLPDLKLKNINTGEEITARSVNHLRKKLIEIGKW